MRERRKRDEFARESLKDKKSSVLERVVGVVVVVEDEDIAARDVGDAVQSNLRTAERLISDWDSTARSSAELVAI